MPDGWTRREVLALGGGAAAGAIGAPGQAPGEEAVLAARAARFRELILQVAMGPGGMIIAFLPYGRRRPFQEGEAVAPYLSRNLEEAWGTFSPRPTVAEWCYGENTLWATGWLLWSQILRYRATREPEALDTARKCFRDLSNLFRISATLEPGLLGKPHGGRPGPTTSYDQAASPVVFYALYAQELATPEERSEAVHNLLSHGDYYLRRNWVMNHHGNLQRIVDPAHTSTMKYLACVQAAYELTGEVRFRDAAARYLRQVVANGKLPWPAERNEVNHNLYYWAFLCDYWHRMNVAPEVDWIRPIGEYWRAAQSAFDARGLMRFGMHVAGTGVFTPYPNRWITRSDAAEWPAQVPRKTERRWLSATCLPNRSFICAFSAALGLLARSHGLDPDAHAAARRILLAIDEAALRWWWWDDGSLPEELRPMLDIFAPEVPAAWLVAYWMGRLQKVW